MNFEIHPNYGDPYYDIPQCIECGADVPEYRAEIDEEGYIERCLCSECKKLYE